MRSTWLSRAVLGGAVLVCGGVLPDGSRAAETVGQPVAPLVRISVAPPKSSLAGARATQGVRVTAEFADGSVRDVTSESEFRSNNDSVATVSAQGVATPRTNGEAVITAKYQNAEATSTLTIGRIDDQAYNFRNDVLPVLEHLTCNQMGCHGSPKGKKRLQLSLFSADPHKDFLAVADREKKLVDVQNPEQSWLLLKATCEEDHGGGDLTEAGSAAYNALVSWIKQGAPEGKAGDPEIVRIEVFPAERRMLPGEKQHLLVEAFYSDGTMRDVTELASFKSDEEAVAKAAASGVIEGTGFGEAVVMVSYSGRLTTSRVVSSQPATVPFPEITTQNRVDELVLAKLKSLNIIPSDLCGDAEFLRRVYLDVIGILPTVEESRAFLADTSPDKRRRLIDSLLDRPEYADFYAVKWGDILQINRNEPAQLQEKGMWVYYRWLWDALDQNKPMDQFVHELLTARGSAYRNGPANFFRVGEGPQGMAEHASTAFLGVRLDCAHCHNHPFEQFTLNDNLGMAAFFTKVRIKRTAEQDEEVICLNETGSIKNPDTNQAAPLKYLGGAEVAGAERAVAAQALVDKQAAEKVAVEKAAALKAATAKAKEEKAAAEKRITAARAATAQANELVQAAKAAAEKAAAELALANKDAATKTGADKEVSDKLVAEKTAAAQQAQEAVTATRNAAEMAQANRTEIEKGANSQIAASNAAVAAANGEKKTADQVLADKTALEREAAAKVANLENAGDPRAKLADWITSPSNPYFARHMANRVWTWLLGRGIIDEPDDFRSTNPASNPELLDYLAAEFIRSGYDMKAMFRLVLNSRTYQLSAQPNPWNHHDKIYYSHYQLKRLTAEQLAAAISHVTGVAEKYPGLPLGTRATQLPDVSMRSEFLDLFGRPKRATPVESERTCDTHIGQSLQMISSEYLASKLRDGTGRLTKLAASSLSAAEAIDELYLVTLCRLPTDTERQFILQEPIANQQRREKFEDLAWVLMNTKEFLFNH